MLLEYFVEQEMFIIFVVKEFVLDVNVEVNGVIGRFGDDGVWYDWIEVMFVGDGVLLVLFYVIFE